MSDRTSIEWTDATWNPIRARAHADPRRLGWHCEHVSDGCRNCYAESFNRRLGTKLDYKPGYRRDLDIFLDDKALLQPLKWRKPRKIFVCSMTDLFADFVSEETLDRVFAVMALCPQHVFQVVTKRPERMRGYLGEPSVVRRICSLAGKLRYEVTPDPDRNPRAFMLLMNQSARLTAWTHPKGAAGMMFAEREPNRDYPSWVAWPLPNVWLGTSVEDQAAADERIPHLLATPAAVRWLSCEPLLGPVDICPTYVPNSLHWVVAGGESSPRARPMHPDWVRSLRAQCHAFSIPFLFKQWGAWAPVEDDSDTRHVRQWVLPPNAPVMLPGEPREYRGRLMHRCGKKEAGRLLDGVQHDAFPALPAPGSQCWGTPA